MTHSGNHFITAVHCTNTRLILFGKIQNKRGDKSQVVTSRLCMRLLHCVNDMYQRPLNIVLSILGFKILNPEMQEFTSVTSATDIRSRLRMEWLQELMLRPLKWALPPVQSGSKKSNQILQGCRLEHLRCSPA